MENKLERRLKAILGDAHRVVWELPRVNLHNTKQARELRNLMKLQRI
jgi:hypothetical protein